MPIIAPSPSTTDPSAAYTEPTVAFFPHARAVRPYSHVSLLEFYRHVQLGVWAKLVAHVRALREQVDAGTDPVCNPAAREAAERAWSAAKAQLPAVTLSADGQTRERSVPLTERGLVPSGRMQIDLDLHGEPAGECDRLRRLLAASEHIEAVWRSPSGDGLKATVRIAGAGDPTKHADCFAVVDRWLLTTIGRANDPSVKDPQRLCFVSHDPDLHLNLAAVELVAGTSVGFVSDPPQGSTSAAGTSVGFVSDPPQGSTSAVGTMILQGQRNVTLFRLGCSLRAKGMTALGIQAALAAENTQRSHPPLPAEDVVRIAASAARYESGVPSSPTDGVRMPDPLPTGLPVVRPFMVDLLPRSFQGFVRDIAERMQAPADFAAVALMVVAGSIVGNRICIRPKRYDDWTVVPNLWAAVVGRPSTLKSPSIAEPIRMLVRLEHAAREIHVQAQEVWSQQQEARQVAKAAAKDRARQAVRRAMDEPDADAVAIARQFLGGRGQDDPNPVRHRYLTNDATVEKLGELLSENPHGILCFRDELVGWLKAMDRDGHEQDRAFHLESFNGTGHFTYDRIGRGTVEIAHAIQSVLGGIQPGPFQAYLADAARGGSGDDGLVQRFQLLVWPDVAADFRLVDRWPDTLAKQDAWAAIQHLDGLDAALVGAADGEVPFLRFAADAQPRWDAWYTQHMQRVRDPQLPAVLAAHLGKQPKTAAALALLIHLLNGGRGPVSDTSLERALGWCTYLEAHARRAYHFALAPDLASAVALGQRIQQGEVPDPCAARDIYRQGWQGLGDRDAVQAAIHVLVDLGWLLPGPAPQEGRGRPAGNRYRINPLVAVLPPAAALVDPWGGALTKPTEVPAAHADSWGGALTKPTEVGSPSVGEVAHG